MRLPGKKIGKYSVRTILADYDLDVRLDMASDVFSIRVPRTPGAKIVGYKENSDADGPRCVTSDYELFENKTLEALKSEVIVFLRTRDTTTFVDVIEYNYSGSCTTKHWVAAQSVGFNFRVARVSVARNAQGVPKLEIPIVVDALGVLSVRRSYGEELSPEQHTYGYHSAIAFTVERWRVCCAIRDGIAKIDKMLFTLLDQDGTDAERKLDALQGNPMLLPGVSDE